MHNTSYNRTRFRIVYAAIAVLSLLFMVWHSEDTGFWYDEYAQISYSALGKTLVETALIPDPTPPLFSVVANLWCRVVPFGQGWLLLLPQIAVALAVYVTGLWGECLGGKRAGVCAAVLLGCSQMVIEQCGFEYRSYAFYLFFAALSAFLLTLRLTGRDGQRMRLAYTLSLVGLLYSHLFGSLLLLAHFCLEVAVILRKRASWKNLLVYAAAELVFLPWVVYITTSTMRILVQARAMWMTVPTFWDVTKLFAYLCANNIVYCLLFVVGCANALYGSLKRRDDCVTLARLMPMWPFILMTVLVFGFSIIRGEYATLWVKRYFTGLFPCASVLAACGIEVMAAAVERKTRSRKVPAFLCCLLLLPVSIVSLYRTAVGDTPLTLYHHREAAEVLLEQADIHNRDTVVLSTLGDFTEAWLSYTVEMDGRRSGFEAKSLYDIDEPFLKRYAVVYVDDGFSGFPKEREEALALLTREYKKTNVWESEQVIRYSRE